MQINNDIRAIVTATALSVIVPGTTLAQPQADVTRLNADLGRAKPTVSGHRLSDPVAQEIGHIVGPGRDSRATAQLIETIEKQLQARHAGQPGTGYDTFEQWRRAALTITAIDHIGYYDGSVLKPGFDQYGPPRTSRALALVYIAMFEVANQFAPAGQHAQSWVAQHGGTIPPLPPGTIEAAAIAGAADRALQTLYGNQTVLIGGLLQATIDDIQAKTGASRLQIEAGVKHGLLVADAVLTTRGKDETVRINALDAAAQAKHLPPPPVGQDASWTADPTLPLFQPKQPPVDGNFPPGQWRPDPVSNLNLALGASWGLLPSFTKLSVADFTLPDPPALSSDIYSKAYQQVLREGGDDRHHRTPRIDTARSDRYFRAKFWAYDATAGLCAPLRLYNEIAEEILKKYHDRLAPHFNAALGHNPDAADDQAATAEAARYFALINTTLADAGIVAWFEKYRHQFWRPVSGIREKEAEGQVPDPETGVIPFKESWYPLGAQLTNSAAGYNITPPFPAYPSGHAVFGSAMFQVLRRLVPNDSGFDFWSDEFNGPEKLLPNVDAYNYVRCHDGDNSPRYCAKLHFASFSDAETDNALSRVWMGVHWNFDASCGDALGERVGDFAIDNTFRLDNAGNASRARSTADLRTCAAAGATLHEPGLPEPAPTRR